MYVQSLEVREQPGWEGKHVKVCAQEGMVASGS